MQEWTPDRKRHSEDCKGNERVDYFIPDRRVPSIRLCEGTGSSNENRGTNFSAIPVPREFAASSKRNKLPQSTKSTQKPPAKRDSIAWSPWLVPSISQFLNPVPSTYVFPLTLNRISTFNARNEEMEILRSPPFNSRALVPAGIVFFFILLVFHSCSQSAESPLFSSPKRKTLEHNWSVVAKDSPLEGPSPDFKKPQGFKIVGLVFYGRRATVSILDCYLQVSHISSKDI